MELFINKDIFVSWNHHDKDILHAFTDSPFFSEDNVEDKMSIWHSDGTSALGGGTETIFKQLECCKIFAVLLSKNSIKSSWVREECRCAIEKLGKSNVVVLIFDDVKWNSEGSVFEEKDEIFTCLARYEDSQSFKMNSNLADAIRNVLFRRLLSDNLKSSYSFKIKYFFENYFDINNLKDEDIYVSRKLTSAKTDVEVDEEQFFNLSDKHIAINAYGGMGKTEFLKHYANKYNAINKDVIDEYYLSTIIECKNIANYFYKNSEEGIINYLSHHFSSLNDNSSYSKDVIIALLNNEKNHICLCFDALDEILDLPKVKTFIGKLNEFTNQFPLVKVIITSRTFFNEFENYEHYELLGFDQNDRYKYAEKVFINAINKINLNNNSDFSSFFVSIKDLAKEIIENPLFLTQLVFIYKLDNKVPNNKYDILEKTSDYSVSKIDETRFVELKVIDDKYGISKSLEYVAYHLLKDGGTFKEQLKEYLYSIDEESDDDVVIKNCNDLYNYLEKRSIVINDNIAYKIFLDFYASRYIYHHSFRRGKAIPDSLLYSEINNYYFSSEFNEALKLLIYKIDSSIVEEDYISSINMMCQAGVGNLDLLFDVKDNLSRKELYIYTISKHILTKTLDRTLGFYEEIFYYANEFDLFDNLFYVGKEILEKDINNPDNIYLVSLLRDLLYISKDYITIDEFTSDKEAINVYQKVVGSYKKTYRNALNGVFYKVGSPDSYRFLVKEKNAYIHPYFWNLKLVLYGRTEQRMSLYTPLLQSFDDELGMFQPYQGDKEKYIGLLFLKRNTLCNETIKELLNSTHVYGCAFDDIIYKTTTPKDEIPTNINYYNTQKVVGVIADVFGLYEDGPYHYISGFSNCYKNNLVTIVYNSNYNSLERELFPLSDLVHNKKKKYLRLFVEGTSNMGIKLDNYNVSEIHLPMDVKNEKQIIEIRKNKIKLCGNIDRELEKEGYDFCSIRYAKRYRDIYIDKDEYEHLVSSDVNKFYSDEQLLSFLPLLDEHYHHDKFVYVQNNGIISLCRQSLADFQINITNHTDKPQCCYANFDIDKYKDVFVVNDHYEDIICYYLAENTIKKHVFEANLKKEIYRQNDKVYDIDAYGFNIHVEISNLFQGTFSVHVNLESCHLDDEIITLPSFKDILGTDKEEGVKVHYVLQVHLFENLPNLKKVIIPEDVTLVQDEAFYNCPNLKEIVFAESGVIDIYSRFLATGKDVEVKFPSDTNYNFIDFTHIKTNNYKNGRYIGDGDNKYAYLVGMIDKSTFFEVHDDCKEILCDIRSVLKVSIPYRLFKEKQTKGLSGVLEVIIRNAPYTIEDLERYAHSEDIDDYYYVDDTFVFDKKSRSIHKVTSKDKVINIPEYFEIKGNKHYVRWIAPFSLSELQNQKVIIPGTVTFFDVYAFGRFDLDGIELVLSEGVQTIFNSRVFDYQSELKDIEELNEQISDPIAQEENRELVGSVEDCVLKNLDYLFIPDSYDFVVVDLRLESSKTLDALCEALKICPLYSSYDVEIFVSFTVMNTLSDIKYIDHNATDEQVKKCKRLFNDSFGLNAFVKNSHTRFYKDDNITAIISGSNIHIYRTKIGKDGKVILPPVEQEIKEISVRKIDFLNSGDISTLDFRNLIIYPGLLDDLLFVEIENLIINQKTEIYDTAVKYKNVYFDEEFFPRRSYNSSTVLSYIDAEHFYIRRNGEYVLIEDLDINDTNIYRGEYCHLKQIKSVTFGENVRSIVGAFNDLDNVKSIIVTEGVLEIDESFKDCLRLEEVILPQSLMRFTNKSLSNCPNLKKIIIPLHVRQYLDIDNRIKEEITKEDGMVEIYF